MTDLDFFVFQPLVETLPAILAYGGLFLLALAICTALEGRAK